METKKKNKTLIIIVVVVVVAAIAILLIRRNTNTGVNYSSEYAGIIDMFGRATTSINDSLSRINQSFAVYQQNANQAKLDQRQQVYDQMNRNRDRSQMYVRGF